MRFLFSTLPGLGHFFPIVPLAWAARAAGHDVLIATTSKPGGERTSGPAGGRRGPRHRRHGGLPYHAGKERGVSFAQGDLSAEMLTRFLVCSLRSATGWPTGRSRWLARGSRTSLSIRPSGGAGHWRQRCCPSPQCCMGSGWDLGGAHPFNRVVFRAMRPASSATASRASRTALSPSSTPPPSMQGHDRPPAWSIRYVPYNEGARSPTGSCNRLPGPASA